MRKLFHVIFRDQVALAASLIDTTLVESVAVELPDGIEIYTGFASDLCFQDAALDEAWKQRAAWYTTKGYKEVHNQNVHIYELAPVLLM